MGDAQRVGAVGAGVSGFDEREIEGVEAIVVHSGGMDSSLCLALAVREYGAGRVLSLGFDYGQRHRDELRRAGNIAGYFGVRRYVVEIGCYGALTRNALIDAGVAITHEAGQAPSTLVMGRNGLMARLAAILGEQIGAHVIYMGVIGVEAANSGYRDCTRAYMDRMQAILRVDVGHDALEIRTPLVDMTKAETMALGHALGCLDYLLDETVTCYRGVARRGCGDCPACALRNAGVAEFLAAHPAVEPPSWWAQG